MRNEEFCFKNDEFCSGHAPFLFKNPDFLLKNPDFLLKTDDFRIQPGTFSDFIMEAPLPATVPVPRGSIFLKDVMSVMRDYFEGTPYDMTVGTCSEEYVYITNATICR